MWTKFNDKMIKRMYPKPNLKGIMVNNMQANWNAIKVIYGSRDANVRLVNKDRTCLFH